MTNEKKGSLALKSTRQMLLVPSMLHRESSQSLNVFCRVFLFSSAPRSLIFTSPGGIAHASAGSMTMPCPSRSNRY